MDKIVTRVSEMMDLPREERSRYLAALPLTRSKSFWAMDGCQHKFVRRLLVRHGAIFREHYCMWGLSVTATFRTQRGMNGFAKDFCKWHNDQVRATNAEEAGLDEETLQDRLWNSTEFWMGEIQAPPALTFAVENHLGDQPKIYKIEKVIQ